MMARAFLPIHEHVFPPTLIKSTLSPPPFLPYVVFKY